MAKTVAQKENEILVTIMFNGDIVTPFHSNRPKVMGYLNDDGLTGLTLLVSQEDASHFVCFTYATYEQAQAARRQSQHLAAIPLLFDESVCDYHYAAGVSQRDKLPADIEEIVLEE